MRKLIRSFFVLALGLSSWGWATESDKGRSGGGPIEINEKALRLIIEGDGLKISMINYLRTIRVNEIEDPEVKASFVRMMDQNLLQKDVQTPRNYVLKSDCRDALDKKVPASTFLGKKDEHGRLVPNLGGEICFDQDELIAVYSKMSLDEEQLTIRLAALAFHEHVHHFQAYEEGKSREHENEANGVAGYVQVTARLAQMPVLRWEPIRSLPKKNNKGFELYSINLEDRQASEVSCGEFADRMTEKVISLSEGTPLNASFKFYQNESIGIRRCSVRIRYVAPQPVSLYSTEGNLANYGCASDDGYYGLRGLALCKNRWSYSGLQDCLNDLPHQKALFEEQTGLKIVASNCAAGSAMARGHWIGPNFVMRTIFEPLFQAFGTPKKVLVSAYIGRYYSKPTWTQVDIDQALANIKDAEGVIARNVPPVDGLGTYEIHYYRDKDYVPPPPPPPPPPPTVTSKLAQYRSQVECESMLPAARKLLETFQISAIKVYCGPYQVGVNNYVHPNSVLADFVKTGFTPSVTNPYMEYKSLDACLSDLPRVEEIYRSKLGIEMKFSLCTMQSTTQENEARNYEVLFYN